MTFFERKIENIAINVKLFEKIKKAKQKVWLFTFITKCN